MQAQRIEYGVGEKPQRALVRGVAVLAMLAMSLVAAVANAATSVSGPITVNTVWTAAQGPYNVTGDVLVQSSAVLTIEPGVTVYFASGTNLTIAAGSLVARGTSIAPIVITSDKDVSAGTPAPGDWGQIRFLDGTNDAGTILEYAQVRYGSGITLSSASPTLNYLNIAKNNGAAIAMDLKSSPAGVGNQASGNTVNGIEVPAGDISGTVAWKLKGIPYVLSAGTISVGQSPSLGALNPNAIQQGETLNFTLTGTRLDGLELVKFDDPNLAVTVLSGATATSVPLTVVAGAGAKAGSAALDVQVAAGKIRLDAALTVIKPQPKIVTITPTSVSAVQGGQTLTVSGINFEATSVVQVDSQDMATTFVSNASLTGILPSLTAGVHTITIKTPDVASPGGFHISNGIALSAIAPYFTVSPASLSLVRGNTGTLTVAMPYPAPVGGLAVTLVSTVPSVATVPANVTIAEGATSATFAVTTVGDGTTTISASRSGFTSGSSVLTVTPPPTITVTPTSTTIGVGLAQTLTIATTTVAGPGGQSIMLASSNTAVATIPATVTIPEGTKSVTTTATTVGIGTATVTASATGYLSGTSTITVRPLSVNLPPALLISPGLSRSMGVVLSDPAPVGGLAIALASSNLSAATVPASVTILEGQTSANVTVTGVAVGSATITATATGYQSGTTAVTVDAVNITLSPSGAISFPETTSLSYAVFISRAAPAGGVTIDLATANTGIATVSPASIFIPEGQTSGGTVKATITGALKGSTSITASSPGLNGLTTAITITGKPLLRFRQYYTSYASATVGKGLGTYTYSPGNYGEWMVERLLNGALYVPPTALTVTLTSSDPTKASVPVTVTIPAGSSGTGVQITGVDLTGATPVTLDATATNYTSPATKLPVNVVAPTLQFLNLDTPRNTLSNRDDFYVRTYVPNNTWANNQTATAALTVALSVTNASTAGIVQYYDAASVGNVITQTTIAVGASQTPTVYVGQPTTTGSYTVTADIPAASAAQTSGTITVNPADLQLRFRQYYTSYASATVGKGLGTYTYSPGNYGEWMVERLLNGALYVPPTALTVTLACSSPAICSVPVTVTIPAGSSGTFVQITGVGLGTTTIVASASGYTSVADLNVSVVMPSLTFSGLVTALKVAGTDAFNLQTSVPNNTWSSNQTAVANIAITLVSSAPDVASVTSPVTFTAGNSLSQAATVTGLLSGSTAITASAPDFNPATSATITVSP